MTLRSRFSRRRFVQALAASPFLAPALAAETPRSANGRLGLGIIGMGTRARQLLGSFLRDAGVQVVAVCDVVQQRRDHGRKLVEDHYARQKGKGSFKGCKTYNDFRDLLGSKDVDAVVLATPDHWHAIPCILAARARKHIYSEKPLTLTIAEGRRIVDEVGKAKVVFQTGSQQRSEFGGKFRLACELVRSGRLGKIKTVRIGVGGPAGPCDLPEQPVPEGTDWEMWNGPAPKRGYNEALCPKGIHNHFPAWRNYREYAGGALADIGAHHFDIAQSALDMDRSGPVKIEPPAGKATSGLRFVYASGIEMFHGGPSGCTFEGTDGILYVDRDKMESKPAEVLKQPLGEKEVRLYRATDQVGNWLECIHNGKETICPAEIGHRSASICHLANIGYQLRRPLRWDPAKERFVDDTEANKLLDREPRAPWKL
ncbi:MAG: Gfo/Idh/MocA family oxidoreductase [Planctomycetes bacterium]|nr:Gfo/Idh/MocA family oxidoreductase [Planctomycetota bacterium]